MTKIYEKLFIGYLLIILDFSLVKHDILPDPLGFILVLIALIALIKKEKSIQLQIGSVICVLLMIYSTSQYFIEIPIEFANPTVHSRLFMVASMLLHASLCVIIYNVTIREYKPRANPVLIRQIEKERRQFIIINVILIFIMSLVLIYHADWMINLIVIIGITLFLVNVRFVWMLYRVLHQYRIWKKSRSRTDHDL